MHILRKDFLFCDQQLFYYTENGNNDAFGEIWEVIPLHIPSFIPDLMAVSKHELLLSRGRDIQ